jgi:hypothetical protein
VVRVSPDVAPILHEDKIDIIHFDKRLLSFYIYIYIYIYIYRERERERERVINRIVKGYARKG